jgi:dynactin complex subunit
VWQKGYVRDVQVKRPKVVFGITPNGTATARPRASSPAAQETRNYVIETDTMRFELRENSTVDTPRMDVLVGDPVEFAVEKKNVWVKDQEGREHKLSLIKESKKESKKEEVRSKKSEVRSEKGGGMS